MYEKFDDGARQAVTLAHSQADRDRAEAIEPAHLLIGVALSSYQSKTGKPATTGALVLKSMGLQDRSTIRQVIEAAQVKTKPVIVGGAPQPPSEEFSGSTTPLTKESRKALELAYREAMSLGHADIRAEHILLGVLRLGDEHVHAALAALVRHNVMARLIYENKQKRAS